MASLNRIILVGRLTANPEALNTVEGNALAKFTLACDRPARPDGVKETDFINIVAWGNLAENCAEYLSKGRLVLIEGRLQQRNFETSDGQKRWTVEVVASRMRILDSSKSAAKATPVAPEAPFPEEPGDLKSAEFVFDENDTEDLESSEVPF
jgi:single-strand DNA-binding protein